VAKYHGNWIENAWIGRPLLLGTPAPADRMANIKTLDDITGNKKAKNGNNNNNSYYAGGEARFVMLW
jgi:hypothetical protein